MKKKDLFCKYYWHTLVNAVVKQLDDMFDFYKEQGEPDICDDIAQCLELGHKLLNFDYNVESNKLANNVDDLINEGNTAAALKEEFRWADIYSNEWKEVEKDLKKFFKLVGQYSGEWL